jgi:serine/threonine protein phosphatase PrpC
MIKDIFKISHRGMRHYMEDNSCVRKKFGKHKDWIFGGVFDGHRGPQVANFAAKNLPKIFLKKIRRGMTEAEAFRESYFEISGRKEFEMVGCCALSFFIREKELFVANAGDCRMVMIFKNRAEQITTDHRLTVIEEMERIQDAGGEIRCGYACRGNDGLAPTRTLGDNYFKGIGIIADPDVFFLEIPNIPDIFLVAATDGVWDFIENDGLVELAKKSNSSEKMANNILSLLLNLESFYPLDNISIIVART